MLPREKSRRLPGPSETLLLLFLKERVNQAHKAGVGNKAGQRAGQVSEISLGGGGGMKGKVLKSPFS